MSDLKRQKIIKQLTHHYMEKQLDGLKKGSKHQDNSFMLLENNTLDLFNLILLLQLDNSKVETEKHESALPYKEFGEVSELIESLREDSKEAFEEIIALLREEA